MPESWFPELVKILAEDVPKSEIESVFKNVSFINFNYDRCLEHYLMQALMGYYDLDQKMAINTLKSLQVLRPYGCVGLLPWQSDNINFRVTFGSDSFSQDNELFQADKGDVLLNHARQIKTFNEKQHNPEALKELQRVVREAESIVFLGFAFHRQNFELIKPNEKCMAKKVFATKWGISGSDWSIIQEDLFKLLGQDDQNRATVHVLNGRCSELFKEFRRSLTS